MTIHGKYNVRQPYQLPTTSDRSHYEMEYVLKHHTYMHKLSIERLSLFVSLSAIIIYSSLTTQPGGIICKLILKRSAQSLDKNLKSI